VENTLTINDNSRCSLENHSVVISPKQNESATMLHI